MIDLAEVGARAGRRADGTAEASFGVYLPNITFPKGYRLKVRIIHERDQYVHGIEPKEHFLDWDAGSPLGLWEATVALDDDPLSHFGDSGRYLYRYQLLRGERPLTFWFSDPFGRAVGLGTQSAFEVDAGPQFVWTDAAFEVPTVDEMVVYELNVREFNRDFDGVVSQLDYLRDLGVNVLELMPVTNVREDVEWGYTPLGFFAPDDRIGGVAGMKRLVNEAHAHGIAVILDAVYAHAHPEYPYNLVYDVTREDNPMMGYFAGEFFSKPGMDYRKRFTADYFLEVNKHWLAEFHVDGFRYDYVPGMYEDNPVGPGYSELVYRTYEHAKTLPKFQAVRRPIIQCAEHLPDPIGVLSKTYTNCAWQNGLLHRARDMARYSYVSADIAHLLDPQFVGYPTEFHDPGAGETLAVAPFQYLETHDHRRFINIFGAAEERDLIGEAYGNRDLFFKVQPYVIALYTAKGIPMLWQGGEFLENWGVPDSGIARNLYERPLHWEYFYDVPGRALVRLHRTMGALRRSKPALGARTAFFYHDLHEHRQRGIIAYRRETAGQRLLVALNFSDSTATVKVPFAQAGRWLERIDGVGVVDVAGDGQSVPIVVASNYGVVYAFT